MPAPTSSQDSKYAIRKSSSVGAVVINNNNKAANNIKQQSSLRSKHNIIDETDHEQATPTNSALNTPSVTPLNGRKKTKLGSLFKWFRNDHQQNSNTTVRTMMLLKTKKSQRRHKVPKTT